MEKKKRRGALTDCMWCKVMGAHMQRSVFVQKKRKEMQTEVEYKLLYTNTGCIMMYCMYHLVCSMLVVDRSSILIVSLLEVFCLKALHTV